MKVVLCVCLALVAVILHGCGGGGTTTTTMKPSATTTQPTTSTAPITTTVTSTAPMITKSPYSFPGIKNGSLTLEWSSPDNKTLKMTLVMTYAGSEQPGWLAVGWSPDGSMAKSDFVIGYESCVRVQQNGDKAGSPPNISGSFNVTGDSFTHAGQTVTLEFTRPLTGLVPVVSSGSFVLTAAGSKSVTPASCDASIGPANAHDLHAFVTGTKIGLLTPKVMGALVV